MGSDKNDIREEYERRKQAEKKAHSIVEKLIENDISEDYFISSLGFLMVDHYKDVIEERSLSNLCGYCLCQNEIKEVLKQAYKIKGNRVFDISERKKFCSDRCFSNSQYVLDQISSTPLWLRNTMQLPIIHLREDTNQKGSQGEEVNLRCVISREEVEALTVEKKEKANFSETTVSNAAHDRMNVTAHQPATGVPKASKKHSSHKIPQQQNNRFHSERSHQIITDTLQVLQEWLTEASLCELGIRIPHSESNTSPNEIHKKKLLLQKQLDHLVSGISKSPAEAPKPLPDYKTLGHDVEDYERRVASFLTGSLRVTERADSVNETEHPSVDNGINTALPEADHRNQLKIRRRIVQDKITKIISSLPQAPLGILRECQKLVSTFSLTSKNVMLSIERWPVVTVMILHLLSLKSQDLKDFLESNGCILEALLEPYNTNSFSVRHAVMAILPPH